MTLHIILFRIIRYLRYWLIQLDEHSLQSPSVYQLYQTALNPSRRRSLHDIELDDMRKALCQDARKIEGNHFGAGSSMYKTRVGQKISLIARYGVSSRDTSEILVNLIEYCQAPNVLELGTSLGLNTLYMSRAAPVESIVTIEGNEELATIARQNFEQYDTGRIHLQVGDIDAYLDKCILRFDLIYIDANHTYDATIRYFEKARLLIRPNGIIVIDDIHWSPGMRKAWATILEENIFGLKVENQNLGIVFVNESMENNHYVLKF